MNRYLRTTLGILLIPVVAVVIYVAYLWLTYIDDAVTTGSAYGFSIGDSKLETYEKAIGALYRLSGDRFSAPFIELKVSKELETPLATRSDYTILVQTYLHDVGYEKFRVLDSWEFYVDGEYSNSLKLRFCQDRLCEIYRHRKFFELP